MNFKKFTNKTDDIIATNNSQRFAIAVLSAVILAEGVLIWKLTNSQRTVFMPPANITKEFWIEGNAVSKTYLDMVLGHVSENMMNITPSNARKSMNTVLPLVKPQFYEEYKKQIAQQVEYIERNDISQTFYQQNIDYSKNGIGDVQGILVSVIGDKVISRKQVHMNIRYEVSDGKFTILNIALKDKDEQEKEMREQQNEEQQ